MYHPSCNKLSPSSYVLPCLADIYSIRFYMLTKISVLYLYSQERYYVLGAKRNDLKREVKLCWWSRVIGRFSFCGKGARSTPVGPVI